MSPARQLAADCAFAMVVVSAAFIWGAVLMLYIYQFA